MVGLVEAGLVMFENTALRMLEAGVFDAKHDDYSCMYIADIVVIVHPDTTVFPIVNETNTILDVANEVVGILTLITDPIGNMLVIWTLSV